MPAAATYGVRVAESVLLAVDDVAAFQLLHFHAVQLVVIYDESKRPRPRLLDDGHGVLLRAKAMASSILDRAAFRNMSSGARESW